MKKQKLFSKINLIHTQQQYNSKAFIEQVKKELLLQDSLRTAEMALLNENNTKIQKTYERLQKQSENTSDKYYFNYSNNPAPADNDEETKTKCPEKSSPSNSYKKI